MLLTAFIAACAGTPVPDSGQASAHIDYMALRGIQAPTPPETNGGKASGISGAKSLEVMADGPYPINLADIPTGVYDPYNQLDSNRGGGRIESQISDELSDLLREEAMLMPAQRSIDQFRLAGPEKLGPVAGVGFESLDYTECCGGGGNVPPDSELAVGPNHIIAVVNVAFEVYDKLGNSLVGPTTFSSFFAGTPGCSNTGVFDPNVIYDEEYDRFILAIDGDGTDYCVAATNTSDPNGSWNRYGFATDVNGNFFDYPHAGVGLDAIYMGANMFAASFAEGRVWALDKFAMYAGTPMAVVTRSLGQDGTPQPMNLHGFAQGTWPAGGPHYILTDGPFDGNNYAVWSWDDPFGADVLSKDGTVNLATSTGISAGFPVDVPQSGSNRNLQANDWRVQDAEYRNGNIWMAHTLACNPGGGTVDCVRWAQIDPTGPSVINAGVLGTDAEYRTFPDVAANDCDDMAIGYTKTSASTFASVFVSGRESGDSPGTLQAESLVKAGEVTYTSFESSGAYRWGDYSGMTIDPDGQTFWYLGEYSKETGAGTKWGDYIASFSFPGCGAPQAPGPATNPVPADTATDIGIDDDLNWTAGSGTDSHDIYFGTSATPAIQVNQAGNSFDPGTLASSTTYYWRIDEVNSVGTTEGTVWSFTTAAAPVQPGAASNPTPVDGATNVSTNTSLGWTEGAGTISNDIYFGTSTTPVLQGNQAGNSFNPGTLASSTTYYWRVDEVNGPLTTTGALWSFTTAAAPAFHISSINVQSIAANGKNRSFGRATITVVGPDGGAGVAISGTFSGDWNGTRNGTTNSNGVLVLETPTVKNGNSWAFCVDTASKAGFEHDTASSGSFLCDGPPAAVGAITGTVTDANGGAPIAGANVSSGSSNDSTDGSGNYTLTNVPTGNAPVNVSAAGYNAASDSVTVTDGGTSSLNFSLTAAPTGGGTGSIKGTVTSNTSAKLSGVLVETDTGQSATTNKGGKYNLQNVPEGSRTVTASKSGFTYTILTGVNVSDGSTTTLNIQMSP